MDSLSEDLEDLEEEVYDVEDDEEDLVDYVDEEGDETDFVEVVCPKCGDKIYFDPQLVSAQGDLYCPSCNSQIPSADAKEE